jgi:tetratricopeptide (TPR) repeat protein
MSLPIMLLIIGFSYIVLFGGISLLRREGLSQRFAIESGIFTLIVSGAAILMGMPTHPVLFLALLYCVTMRVRLMVDLGNFFAGRGSFGYADQLYRLALWMWPDPTGRLITQVNQAIALLQQNKLDEAIVAFHSVLEKSNQGYLGVKYESATHYNLGVAYLRKNLEAQAAVEFNAVLDTWPASVYARRAASALEQRRRKNMSASDQEKQ